MVGNKKGYNYDCRERISAYINSLSKELPEELIRLEEEAHNNNVPIIKEETQGLLHF